MTENKEIERVRDKERGVETERELEEVQILACRTRRRFPHEFAKQLLIPLTRGHVFSGILFDVYKLHQKLANKFSYSLLPPKCTQ